MSVIKCIFCDVPLAPSQNDLASSRSREHVYAKWYRDNVVNNRMKMFTATVGSTPVLERQPTLKQLVTPVVCSLCNSGWMSALEVSVDPIIQQLCDGNDIGPLLPSDIEILARWAAKTVTVLSYVTPLHARVPRRASLSLHPDSKIVPQIRVFYGKIIADLTLEGGYLQLNFGSEIGLVDSGELLGTRITLCVYNHCLTVDFPPMLHGLNYDLSESCSAQIWPTCIPAGTSQLTIATPARIGEVLYAIGSRIKMAYNVDALRT